ncbi:uncharacterized conserved protein [Hahella chejuensis KCTC 2396]|uniref:Corrinoid adenosyltransferase n=1 Tax=Hahella chejuensis (strain KCTC 2396) TaxID=349521 RepID=Q2SKR5_HAHCH|nr:cob(I)yrinic acid a,c-diamide adenosyltransferase [Hahella chejuensis]ABC28759.1 uncharacterized conserved protein [Hahella chejuensis KCTC 2396]
MGHRLSKIYTRTGDKGTTGLGNGERIAKNALRVEAMGAVDETNSVLGVVICELTQDDPLHAQLQSIQNDLFDLGGELSIPGHIIIIDKHISRLEEWLDQINEELPPLKNFILPGGDRAASHCHMARSICRRAERTVVSLAQQEQLNPCLQGYLNRLSDYLFVAARALARRNGGEEILWVQTKWEA